jgi:hypothetical protein
MSDHTLGHIDQHILGGGPDGTVRDDPSPT